MRQPIRRHRERHDRYANALSYVCVATISLFLVLLAFVVTRYARPTAISASVKGNRFCVDMLRHRVAPEPPVLAPDRQEPMAFGWLDADLYKGELAWRIVDSLDAHVNALAIHGPLAAGEHTAPVFIKLHLTRDASGRRLAGVQTVEQDKLRAINARPGLYYMSAEEVHADGRSTRELARCPLDAFARVC